MMIICGQVLLAVGCVGLESIRLLSLLDSIGLLLIDWIVVVGDSVRQIEFKQDNCFSFRFFKKID
jgi:hypothetical protein